MKITKKRWLEAQVAERLLHKEELSVGIDHYRNVYEHYFRYLGMKSDQNGKSIMEVGPADFPALRYCTNISPSFIIEPMPSPLLDSFADNYPLIALIKRPLEEVYFKCDEIWLFNVMQHIIDQDLFIHKCKMMASTIRFFEPINEPVTTYHPHTYSADDFIKWFGEVNFYKDQIFQFHTAECVYGTWVKK